MMAQFGEERCRLCIPRMFYDVSPRASRVTEFRLSLGRIWAGGGFGLGGSFGANPGGRRET